MSDNRPSNLITLLFFYSVLVIFFTINRQISAVVLFLVLIAHIWLSPKTSIYPIFFILPYYGVFLYPGIGVLIPYVLLMYVVRQFSLLTRIKYDKSLVLIWVVLVLSQIVSSFIFKFDLRTNLESIIFIVVLFSVSFLIKKGNSSLVWLVIFYSVGLIVSGVIGSQIDHGDLGGVWIDKTMKSRFLACMGDPNYLSRAILFAISFCYVLIINNIKYTKFIYLIVSILFILLILTLSKMGFLVFLFITLLFIYKKYKSQLQHPIKIFFISITIIILALYILPKIPGFNDLIDRFKQADSLQTLTTNRTLLQSTALEKFTDQNNITVFLFGFGINSSRELTKEVLKQGNVLHSIYAQAIVEQGLFGFLTLLIFLIIIFKRSKRTFYFPSAVFVITGFALSGMYYWDQFFYYVLLESFYYSNYKILESTL